MYLRLPAKREPVRILALLWPLILVAPVLPGLPRPSISAYGWRQELVAAMLLVATLVACVRHFSRRGHCLTRIRQSQFLLLFPLSLFVLWSGASLAWAENSFPVFHYLLTWGAYLLFFILVLAIVQKPQLLGAGLGTLAVVISILSLICSLEFWSSNPEFFQFSLLFRRFIGLGEPLAMVVPLFAALALTLKRSRPALLFGIAMLLAWLATMQTLERAPTIGACVGLLLLAVGMLCKRDWRPRTRGRVLLLLAAFIAVTAFQNLPSGTDGTSSSSLARLQSGFNNDSSTQVRLLVWAIGLEMVREHPLTGVGAGNYEIAYPEARAKFSERAFNSPFAGLHEELLVQRAHNEYIQMLAELGIVGFVLFLLFCSVLMWLAIRVLRFARNPIAIGALASMAAFAISSGASSVSFRWLGSGLLFFFCTAIVWRFAETTSSSTRRIELAPRFMRLATVGGSIFAFVMLCIAGALGINSTLHAFALETARNEAHQSKEANQESTERLFRSSLRWNPYDGPTNFSFGLWLDGEGRSLEAVSHLRFAVAHGLNSAPCYALLAAAEAKAGEMAAAEKTLASAVKVYPGSVFLRVRHAIALAEIGEMDQSTRQYEAAMALDAPVARGWRQLMCFGAEAAHTAAYTNSKIASPKDLYPTAWASPAIAEHAKRQPTAYPEDENDYLTLSARPFNATVGN